MDGFLNLDKPPHFTSHDCVAKLRKILNTKKIGHGGTLDPLAVGVLPIAIGKATRLLQFLPSAKIYEGKIRFGVTTTTDDLEGDIIRDNNAHNLTLMEVEKYLSNFMGNIQQIPPAFSAIKKDGKKLYDLARKGEILEIPSRQIFIKKIEILQWQEGIYPELDLRIYCETGTYIRSIARDLGAKVGYGATLAGLKRTFSCGMKGENSQTFETIIKDKQEDKLTLIPLDLPLINLDKICLNIEQSLKWIQGQKINLDIEKTELYYRTYNHENQFIGISELRDINTQLIKPKIVIT